MTNPSDSNGSDLHDRIIADSLQSAEAGTPPDRIVALKMSLSGPLAEVVRPHPASEL
jgi:hypothetical protein